MKDPTVRLKRLLSKDDYGPEFIRAAQEDLPVVLGRLSLLEEFFDQTRPGPTERTRNLTDQLTEAQPPRFRRRSWLRRMTAALASW